MNLHFLILFTTLVVVLRGFGQGTVNFGNIGGSAGGPVNAPIRDATLFGMPLCSGPGYRAQLYWGPSGTSDGNVLTTNGVGGAPASFLTGTNAGYFIGGVRTVYGALGGSIITAQVRAWRADFGASWETALVRGESNLVQFTLDTPPGGGLNLVGLQPFNLYAVPEPGAWALLALGGMAFLVRHAKAREMNTRIFILFATLVAFRSFGQGEVFFANITGPSGGSVNAPVRDASLPEMPLCSGSDYLAQLYWGPAGASNPTLLITNGISGAPASFLSSNLAGYFTGSTRRIDGASGAEDITIQVRAWRADSGSNWESALVRGESNLIQVRPTIPPPPAASLIGLQPFNLYAVPEPGAWALLALGGMAFWGIARRRRK